MRLFILSWTKPNRKSAMANCWYLVTLVILVLLLKERRVFGKSVKKTTCQRWETRSRTPDNNLPTTQSSAEEFRTMDCTRVSDSLDLEQHPDTKDPQH